VAKNGADNAGGAFERVTIAEAAALLGCHPNTVRYRIRVGMYRAEKIDAERGPTWMIERESLTTGDSNEVSDRDGPLGEPAPPLRGGSLPLPGLKHWRLRKRLSQKELARRVGLTSHHLYKIESGKRGCNPETAQLLADVLQVDLEDLRRRREDALEGKAIPKPDRPRIPYRNVHQAYLKLILKRAVGSAYAAMDEWEIEEHCEEGTWEDAIKAVRAREREIGYLDETFGAKGALLDPDLPDDVRTFLESVLDSFPDLDIHLLAMARRREPSEEGHEALTKAMRDLL
jgi:transcriptional regulator with XRE-family HTH domain